MIWIGVFVGIGLGIVFESLQVGIVMVLIGAGIGFAISLKRNGGKSVPANEKRFTVEARLGLLQTQVRHLTDRLAVLEQRLGENDMTLATPSPSTSGVATAAVEPVEEPRYAGGAEVLPPAPSPVKPNTPIDPTVPLVVRPMPAAHAVAATAHSEPITLRPDTPTPAAIAASTPALPPPPAPAPRPAPPAAARVRTPPRPPAEPGALEIFFKRWIIGGNPLVKIGVLILFLGLAFLLRYAAEHAVLPVEYRYAGVAASGIALLLFGWRWRLKKDNYGLILQGSGIAVLYLTTLAAMRLHPLIPLEFGFGILIGVAAFAALLAVLQDSLVLALVATIGGFAAPVLASSGSGNHIALFSYLTLLNLGIVSIAWFKAWRPLNLVGFCGTLILAGAWAVKYYQPAKFATTEPFLLLLFGLYVLVTFLFARRTLAQAGTGFAEQFARIGYIDGTLVFGVPTATFALQLLLIKPWEYGAAFSALGYGMFYIVLAFLLFRGSGARYRLLSETMIALAVVFGSLAIPLGLDSRMTSAAWAVEAAGIFWIGVQQQRSHARWFALLLLLGSASYFALGLEVGDVAVALHGSALGALLLAISSGLIYRTMRAAMTDLSEFERGVRPWVLATAALFAGVLPFLLLTLGWASPALAVLGSVIVLVASRLQERPLLFQALTYQTLAGVLFVSTLHAGASGSVLGNGWSGLVAAALVGGSMLAGVWALTRQPGDAAAAPGPVAFGAVASVGIVAGLAFFNLAPLFVLPWRIALLVWPVTGLLTLWWAMRVRHLPSLLFGLGLQVAAGIAYLSTRLLIDSDVPVHATAFAHLGFIAPILIALAALFCAWLLQRKAALPSDRPLGWIALVWSGGWWALAWCGEFARLLAPSNQVAAVIGVLVATTLIAVVVARSAQWQQLGQATLAYVPLLAVLAVWQWDGIGSHPLAAWNMLLWPLALLVHGLLLRRQTDWLARPQLGPAHTLGAWLFVVLAALEMRWRLGTMGEPNSAWALLGWMMAPVAFLFAVTRQSMQKRWPLRDFSTAYLRDACVPMVLYLLGWIWVSNLLSDGTAAPLPYLPLINPLELAQLAALLGVASWWSERRGAASTGVVAIGSTAFAMLTGAVVRSCHHWTNVPWQIDALLASNLVQTALSITWSIVAIALMLTGNRRAQRWIWITGALLMAVVVAKLFLVELSATGSLARIVSFIVVGLLLLVVGYFAPLPPKLNSPEKAEPA